MDKKIYRYKKWAHLFQFLDLDQDGVLSFEEYMYLPVRLITSGKVEHGTRLALLYNTLWNKVFQGAGLNVGQLQVDQKTFQIGHDFVSKIPWYKDEFLPGIVSDYFDSVDTDNDGEISFVEWANLYKNRGVTDDAFIKCTFSKMDKNNDGTISKAEFLYAVKMFGLNEDEGNDYSFSILTCYKIFVTCTPSRMFSKLRRFPECGGESILNTVL